MTCPSFDRSWLYRELDKFYMREMYQQVLSSGSLVFRDSAELARFLPPICHQIPLTDSV